MRKPLELLATAAALLFLVLPTFALHSYGYSNDQLALNPYVKEFHLPRNGTVPWAVTVSRNGTVWFTESEVGSIGSFDPATNSWHEYKDPSLGANSSFPEIGYQMYGIKTDAKGNVWFTSWQGDRVVEFNTSTSKFTPYILGPEDVGAPNNLEPYAILIRNGTVWFSLYNGNGIGKLNSQNGNVTVYHPSCSCTVGEIAPGPDGTIWFTIPESGVGKIGVFNTQTTQFQVVKRVTFDNGQFSLDEPTGLAVDQSGRMWVTDVGSDTINEFVPSLQTGNLSVMGYWNTQLPGFANRTEPLGIAADGQGNIWFAESNAARVGLFHPAERTLTEYVIPSGSDPHDIAVDGQGRVWFTEPFSNKLGMIDPRTPLPFNISTSSANLTLAQGSTSSLFVDLKTASGYNPSSPLKVWVTGVPFQDFRYSFGNSTQLPGGVARFQLLLRATSSLPVGTYTATISVESPTLIQGAIVNVEATRPLNGYPAGIYLPVAVVGGALTLIAVFIARHQRSPGNGRTRFVVRHRRPFLVLFVAGILLIAFAAVPLLPRNGGLSGTPQGGQHNTNQAGRPVNVTKTTLNAARFDAITKFALPEPLLFPNGIAATPDGSVWFGEGGLPGVAHLFPNGTYVKYRWPPNPAYRVSPNGAAPKTDIWGVALWNGMVWASDAVGNEVVGVDPSTGSVKPVSIPANDSYPFALAVGPDNSLWFTEIRAAEVGRIFPNYTLVEYPVPSNVQGTVTDLTFINGTGYFVADGAYAFSATNFDPHMVSTPQLLYQPVGISYSNGLIWAAEHDTSGVISYSLHDRIWTTYPTSTENYTLTTLPYFIVANGSYVWFNEHYGNRMAKIDLSKGTLTEYAESNPPPTRGSQIDNALTFAVAGDRVWFTELTGNYVGYVDASYKPTFSISIEGNSTLKIPQGGIKEATFLVDGYSESQLTVRFSDSERYSALPASIQMNSSVRVIQSLAGQETIKVTIAVNKNLNPGTYTLLVTLFDGLVYRSKYLTLQVTASEGG